MDYPDNTRLFWLFATSVTIPISIEASEVTIPVSIAASDVTLPISIDAATVTLDVNLAAQAADIDVSIQSSAITLNVNITNAQVDINIAAAAVTLDVNLAASDVTLPISIDAATVTLDVNIAASAITVSINFSDQSVAVFDAAKWFAHNAAQVFVYGSVDVAAGVTALIVTRTVPAAKVFYLAGFSYGAYQGSQPTHLFAYLRLGASNIMPHGSQQGSGLIFDVPIRATAAQVVEMRITNDDTAGSAYIDGAFWGWDEEV